MAATGVARGSEQSCKSAVFIKAENESNDDRQAASAEYAHVAATVFRAKNKQSDKDPKGHITLRTTIHKKPPVSCRRGYVLRLFIPLTFYGEYLRFYLSITFYSQNSYFVFKKVPL